MELLRLFLTLTGTIFFLLMTLGFGAHIGLHLVGYLSRFTYVGMYYIEGVSNGRFRLNLPAAHTRRRKAMDIAASFLLGLWITFLNRVFRNPNALDEMLRSGSMPIAFSGIVLLTLVAIYALSALTERDPRPWWQKTESISLAPSSWKKIF